MKNCPLFGRIAAMVRPGRSGLWTAALGLLSVTTAWQANATDGTWTNTASGGLWSQPTNWNGGVVADGAAAVADFSTLNITAHNTVLLDSPRTLGGLLFGDTASTVYNWTLNNNGDAANMLTLAGDSPFFTITNGTVTNNLVLAGTRGFSVNGGAAASGLVLAAANTFTGDITANAGTGGNLGLYLRNASALGGSESASNTVTLVGNASTRAILYLNVSGASYPAYNHLLMRPTGASGSSRAELRSASGNATWNGDIVVDGVSGSTLPNADLYCDGGSSTFTVNGSITSTNYYVGFVGLRGNNTGVMNGTINTEAATVYKNDTGTWTITSSNNNWVNTLVGNGKLKLGCDNALPLSATLTMGGSGTAILDLNGYKQTVTALANNGSNARIITNSTGLTILTVSNDVDTSYSGTIAGSLNLKKLGTATLTLSGSGTYSGTTEINNGTLALSGNNALSGSTNIIIGAATTLDASASGFSLGAKQTLSPVDASSTLVGNVNVGSGTLMLNYSNNAPALTVSGGNMVLSAASVVIINVPSTLSIGSYLVVTVANNGQVSGTMPSAVTVNGVSGLGGTLSVTNGELYLTLNTRPTIASQLPVTYTNLATLFVGASPEFSIAAGGVGPFGYLWYTNGVPNTAAATSSMLWPNMQAGTQSVYCVVTNDFGAATSAVWTASVIAAPTQPYPQAVLSNAPIGYWRLNEPDNGAANANAGAVANDYLGANNGVYTNTDLGLEGYNTFTDPTITSARFGIASAVTSGAFGIEGVDFGSASNTTRAFTIEAWVNGYAPLIDSGIVTKGYGNGGEQFNLDTGGTSHGFRFSVRDAGGAAHNASSAIVPDYGTWHHVVGVCDEPNGQVTLYVDGQAVATSKIGTNAGILTATSPMSIGARASSATAMAANNYDLQFSGNINDVAVYDYALSASDVQAHYFTAGVAPVITTNPAASLEVNANSTVTITAGARGTEPLSYQWFDVNAGTYLANQTNATLVISNLLSGNSYYLTVTNAYGSVQTAPVVVSVIPGLFTTLTPSVGWTTYAGGVHSFSVKATGTEPFYFQWFTNGIAVSGATNATLSLPIPLGNAAVACAVTNSYSGFSSNWLGPVVFTGVAAPTNRYEVGVLADSPLAYWALNEVGNAQNAGNGGVIAYDYVGGHNGAYTNANLGLEGLDPINLPTLTSAEFGTYAGLDSFMGEIDNVAAGIPNIDFATPSGSNAQFSVEAWVYCTNANQLSDVAIVAKGCGHAEQFSLDLYNNIFRFFTRDASGASRGVTAVRLTANTWYHLVGVWDGANGAEYLYVNGANVARTTGLATGLGLYSVPANATLPGSSLISIGSRPDATTTNVYDVQLQGQVANVALYNYALSSNQVVSHYYNVTNYAVVTPGTLQIRDQHNGQVQLVWDFNGALQSATNAAGPYVTETNAVSPYTIPTTNSQIFFRVKQR